MVPNKIKRILAGSFVLAMTLSIGGCTTITNEKSTAELLPVGSSASTGNTGYRTTQVYEGEFALTYDAYAEVVYTASQNLSWDNAQDRYGEILVSTGDVVKKGDVLATFIGSSSADVDVLEKELAVQEAQNALNKTVRNYENSIAKKKNSMQSLTGYDYDIANLELEKLRSEYAQRVEEAEYQIARQQEALAETTEKRDKKELLAPFDGKISGVNPDCREGNKVMPGTPIIQISDESSRIMSLQSTDYISQVPYLSRVTLQDPMAQLEYEGTVVSCASVSGNSRVIVQLDQEIPKDREEAKYKAQGYVAKKENVTLVDNEAIRDEGNKKYVYVLNENNARYKVYIATGKTNNGITWVMDGLTPGQTVALD